MMKNLLTVKTLIIEAKNFCETEALNNHAELIGVTDGKAVGTYIEHKLREYLSSRYIFTAGSSAKGIDFPDKNINTDLKVTSISQPQSSCPFNSSRQKIFGLGYNLLVIVYEKIDTANNCRLRFVSCTFIDKSRTADYTATKRLREMLNDGANKEDLISYLADRNIPGDEITYDNLAEELLRTTPTQGYLTISNALQWRLQYARATTLGNKVNGIVNYEW